ncbi:MAG: hypothetical protein ACYSYU_06640, partial [Planctomycetota bacterium]
MAEISGLKTLKQATEELIFVGDKPESNYFRYLQLMIRGFKEAKMFHLKGFTKVAKLTVSDIKTIDLPTDYLSFVSVVVPISGEYWSLTEKETLVFSQSGSSLVEDDEEGEDINDAYSITYGATGGKNKQGYIKLDEVNNRIIINSLAVGKTEVFLIYVSSGVNAAGTDTYIPDAIVPMLHFYVLYKEAIYNDKPYEHLRDEYYRELDKVRYLQMPSLEAMRDALYEVFTS